MTIQDLGSLGELIAAIGVIVSLVYLAVQIRQNTNAVVASAVHNGLSLMADSRKATLSDPDVSSIYLRGLEEPTNLNEEELLRFRLILANIMDAVFNTYVQTKATSFAPDTWVAQSKTAERILRTKGGQWFWGSFKDEYQADFRSEIDKVTKSGV